MIFSKIDDKKECKAIYINNTFYRSDQASAFPLTRTWSYSRGLSDKVEFAQIYVKGKTIKESCPVHLKQDLKVIEDKMKSYFNCFKNAKIDPDEFCLYDLIPEKQLKAFCEVKNKITQHVFETVEKPDNYDFLLELYKFIQDISQQKLNIQTDNKSLNYLPYIKYKLHGTKTNRFTTAPNSFPILTLKKEYRKILKPSNDKFVELDYNGADIRVAIGLLDMQQPQEDLYAWISRGIFPGMDRDKIKRTLFSWLYNPESRCDELERVLDRSKLLSKHWDGEYVTTFGKGKIKADKEHALSYLIQGSQMDVFGDCVLKIHKLLKNKKSKISWVIHDSVTIDYSEDENLLDEIMELFSNTKLGRFKINRSEGYNFGEMEK